MKLLLLFLLSVVRGSRYYCYKGSSLYQIEYVDCGDLNGQSEWYCSKVTVCENDIDSERECIETRGCATKSECTNPANGKIYNGARVIVNGSEPAGMKISVQCCKAHKFADDDALAVDMSQICNSAGRIATSFISMIAVICVTIMLAFKD